MFSKHNALYIATRILYPINISRETNPTPFSNTCLSKQKRPQSTTQSRQVPQAIFMHVIEGKVRQKLRMPWHIHAPFIRSAGLAAGPWTSIASTTGRIMKDAARHITKKHHVSSWCSTQSIYVTGLENWTIFFLFDVDVWKVPEFPLLIPLGLFNEERHLDVYTQFI